MRGREPRVENRESTFDFRLSILSILFSILSLLFSSLAFAWHPPQVRKVTLPNGFRLYLLPDHTLPLFRAKLFVETGNVDEPSKKNGLADLTATLLTTGGTKQKTPEEVDRWLEQRAIHLGAEAGRELTSFTLSCLSARQEEALDFLKEALLEPRFDNDRFILAKRQFLEGLRREDDLPETIVSHRFRELIYGADNPWGRYPHPQTVDKIEQKDIAAFYQKYFHPNQMLLTVAGDFSPQKIERWVRENFGPLPHAEVEKPAWQILPMTTQPEEKKIKKKLTQAFIEVGHLALTRNQKEKYAYSLLQHILGGDVFTSRLGIDIRTTLGLAYSVYTAVDSNPVRGFFKIHVETRQEALETVLGRIRFHLKQISENFDITQKELDRAKESLINQYIFWFDSSFDTVEMQARMDLLGVEKDYLQKYPERIRAVTLEELKKVAKEYIRPDGLKTVIVGP